MLMKHALNFLPILISLTPTSTIATHAYYVFDTTKPGAETTYEAMSITQVWNRVEVTNWTDVYGANEFFFENGITGYFGGLAEHTWNPSTKTIGLKHTLDFAIWDFCGVPRYGSKPCSSGHKVTSFPLDTSRCERFGGEGTGSHCGVPLEMIQGREYSFHLELSMQNASGAGWRATVVDEFTGLEHPLGSLFLLNTPHYRTTTANVKRNMEGIGNVVANAITSRKSAINGYGGLTLMEPGTTHHKANRTDPVTGQTVLLGGLSFQEYFQYNDPNFDPQHKLIFYSSFGWIGPRFFPNSSADGGAAVRRGRGPRSAEAIVPARILVDSGGDKPDGVVTSGCIPGYPCGGDRVFYVAGPQIVSDPPPGTVRWIWNGTTPQTPKKEKKKKASVLRPSPYSSSRSIRKYGWELLNAVDAWHGDGKDGGPPLWHLNRTKQAGVIARDIIPRARDAGVTDIQLQQQLFWNAEDAFNADVAAMAAIVSQAAHASGDIKVHAWTHELSSCPSGCLASDGKRCVLNETLWTKVHNKYESFWKAVPDLDGVVLTLTETAYDVTKDSSTVSDQLPAVRLQTLIKTIAGATPAGKELTIRSFAHTAAEHSLMHEALNGLTGLPDGIRVSIMIKAHPTDWLTYYPFNADFNPWVNTTFTQRHDWDIWMEMDVGAEFLGQNAFPYAQVEYVQNLARQAVLMNVTGVVARVERSCLPSEVAGNRGSCVSGQPATSIFGTLNEVSLEALSEMVEDVSTSPHDIYSKFATRAYGSEASPYICRALDVTFEAVNRAFYPLRQWFSMQHSNVPSWSYIKECLDPVRGYAAEFVWVPSPTETIFNRQIRRPSFAEMSIIEAEIDIADALAGSALDAIHRAQSAGYLNATASRSLLTAFGVTRDAVTLAGTIGRVVTAANCLLQSSSSPQVELPGERSSLLHKVEGWLATLMEEFVTSPAAAVREWPLSPDSGRVENFVNETRRMLEEASLLQPHY